MKKTEKLMILMSVVLVSLLAIGAVSAADANETVIGDDTDSGEDSGFDPVDKPIAPKPIEKPTVTEPAGDFSDLDDKIVAAQVNHNGTLELDGDYQNTGDEKGITIKARTDEDGTIHNNLTIEGNDHTIDAQYSSTIFTIDEGMDFVIIQNLNFINAYTEDGVGGAILSNANLTLINVTFIDNTALHGGAIYDNASLEMENVAFINNTADGDEASGGAIFTTGNFADLFEKVIFINNTADYGGAIYGEADFLLAMDKAIFIGNEALYGGAICSDNEFALAINNAIFADNSADYCGGAIYSGADESELNNVTFIENIAGAYGGAIYSNSTSFEISNGTFKYNMAYAPNDLLDTPEGGAIYGDNLILKIVNSTFESNTATNALGKAGNGGAISAFIAVIEDSTFNYNTAIIEGGAIQAEFITIDNVYFEGNTATYGGAIILVECDEYDEKSKIVDSIFEGNNADETGGAIYTNNPLTIKTSGFLGNTAIKGGAIYSNDKLTVYSSNFAENGLDEEYSFGGAIYQDEPGELYVGKKSTQDDPCTFANDMAAFGSEIYVDEAVESSTVKDKTEIANVEGKDSLMGVETVGSGVKFFTMTELDFDVVNQATGDVAIMVYMYNLNVDDEDLYNVYIYGEKVNITILDENGELIILNDEHTIGGIYYPEAFYYDLPNGTYSIIITYKGNNNYYASDLEDTFNVFNMTAVLEDIYDEGYDKGYDDAEYIANITIQNLTDENNKLNETNKNLTDENEKLNETNKNLTAENNKLNETNKNLTHQNNVLVEGNFLLKTEKDDANKALAAKNAEAAQLTADKTNLQNQVTTLQGQVTTLQQQNTEASAKIKKVSAKSKVKKSKKFKITVTLSSTKVNGKYVYVIFNGKSYKAKVKKGKATITIKPSALKKLGGKTVKYSVVYDQSIKNKSVKVKK